MDALNVHIFVKDEPAPRQFVVTGGAFDTMKAAVKTAGARYDGDRKSWALPSPGAFDVLKRLREQYTVDEIAILRLKKYFEEMSQDVDKCTSGHMLDWRDATWTINTTLRLEVQTSQDQLGYGDWRKLPDVPVSIEIAPDVALSHAEKMLAGSWTPAQVHGLSIARSIVRDELERRADAANQRMLELLRNRTRTKENIIEAAKTLLNEFGLTLEAR